MAPPFPKRSARKPTSRKPPSSFGRRNTKPNASILSFFKKVEVEQTLFCDSAQAGEIEEPNTTIHDESDGENAAGINLSNSPSKRRKLDPDIVGESSRTAVDVRTLCGEALSPPRVSATSKIVGGFVLDSDSDDDDEIDDSPPMEAKTKAPPDAEDAIARNSESDENRSSCEDQGDATALDEEFEEEQEMPDLGDISHDFIGEEYREMLFSQEQARIEAEEKGHHIGDQAPQMPLDDSVIESCPICSGSLAGAGPDEITRHVNSCLDGNPTPLPTPSKPVPESPSRVTAPSSLALRAAVPRPGQRDPHSIHGEMQVSSAFSKLMSGNAESLAWETAAAAATASRGKPAYKRTCPFYKIMPGFSISVDAFRYGAVKDCSAYFLSHFHSDHYVGLSASWKHGPIYCSRVTGRLAKQQLKVDPKWIVELEFNERFDIPGTDGAWVTMIPANHCPGSSMFLFEKEVSNGPKARLQRILHCGDFRACPEHVAHEGLKPDVLDQVSGKLRQQKIDICYLDTTYLSPRWAFPPQMDVITACADLCADLNSNPATADATWDKLERDTSNPTVSGFFTKEGGESTSELPGPRRNRLLVVCGTYSIGKERICVAIAKALNTKIYASAHKMRIFMQLDDPELSALLTTDPLEAQVHMQMIMEIRAETLQEYLNDFKPHFGRIVGFRPSGWNYRPSGASKLISANTQPSAVPTMQILHSKAWSTGFGVGNLQRQRGSTKEAMCFGVPYSEHSSFRELALFLMALRIERVVPTVNVGSETSRKKMKGWIDKWLGDRAKGGVLRIRDRDAEADGGAIEEWDGKGKREVYW